MYLAFVLEGTPPKINSWNLKSWWFGIWFSFFSRGCILRWTIWNLPGSKSNNSGDDPWIQDSRTQLCIDCISNPNIIHWAPVAKIQPGYTIISRSFVLKEVCWCLSLLREILKLTSIFRIDWNHQLGFSFYIPTCMPHISRLLGPVSSQKKNFARFDVFFSSPGRPPSFFSHTVAWFRNPKANHLECINLPYRLWFQIFFFIPIWGRFQFWHIFQMGWNQTTSSK